MATKARPIAPRTPDVVTLGECMAVIYPRTAIGLERATGVLLNIAGSEANTAIGLARLGIGARFISRVGEDPFGRRIREVLTGEHVDTRYLTADPTAPTGVFFREWLKDGARRVYYYRAGSAASRLGPEDLRSEAFAGAKIVHLSGITPALSGACAAAVRRAIDLIGSVRRYGGEPPRRRRDLPVQRYRGVDSPGPRTRHRRNSAHRQQWPAAQVN